MVQQSIKDTNKDGRYVKIKQAAAQLYDLVKDEKRADGTPAFARMESVYSNLHNALNQGYIYGAKESPHVTWIHMDTAEEYIMEWIEQANKTTGNVRLYRKKKHRHVGKRTVKPSVNGASKAADMGSEGDKLYLLTDKDGVAVATIQASGKWAASAAALKHLEYTIQAMPKMITA